MAQATTANELSAMIARGEYMHLLSGGMTTTEKEDSVISALASFMSWKVFGDKSTEGTFLTFIQFAKTALLAGKEIEGANHE